MNARLVIGDVMWYITAADINRRPAGLYRSVWTPVDPADAPAVVREMHEVLKAHTNTTD